MDINKEGMALCGKYTTGIFYHSAVASAALFSHHKDVFHIEKHMPQYSDDDTKIHLPRPATEITLHSPSSNYLPQTT